MHVGQNEGAICERVLTRALCTILPDSPHRVDPEVLPGKRYDVLASGLTGDLFYARFNNGDDREHSSLHCRDFSE